MGTPILFFAQWAIGDERYVGQAVIPYSSYEVDEDCFCSSSKRKTQWMICTMAIYDSENSVMRNGTFANKEELKTTRHWWSTTISPSITLESGKLYRVVLLFDKLNYT